MMTSKVLSFRSLKADLKKLQAENENLNRLLRSPGEPLENYTRRENLRFMDTVPESRGENRQDIIYDWF